MRRSFLPLCRTRKKEHLLTSLNTSISKGGGDNIRSYLGTVCVATSMYGITKVLKELQEQADDIAEYTENMNEFNAYLVQKTMRVTPCVYWIQVMLSFLLQRLYISFTFLPRSIDRDLIFNWENNNIFFAAFVIMSTFSSSKVLQKYNYLLPNLIQKYDEGNVANSWGMGSKI